MFDFLKTLTDEEFIFIVKAFNEMNTTGMTNDKVLREMIDSVPKNSVLVVSTEIAMEGLRRYYNIMTN